MTTSTVSFPGLGILPFELNRVALSLGSVKIYWYGVIICLGIVLGFAVAYLRMRKIGVTGDDLADIALICVPSAIVGARLYYVLAELESYSLRLCADTRKSRFLRCMTAPPPDLFSGR